ncbi:GNAT family N-acetyltransferase [Bacillus sp. DJP31]|uniref:GNAT family N-acetyltransferase n=1 Tax=Bacillus sp. DJP31 TaxID=3409789 RepID=UPI003BB7D695
MNRLYINQWFQNHGGRFPVLVAELNGNLLGWGSLNQFNPRKAYNGVADLSVYIKREFRGKDIGKSLLKELEILAIQHGFYKIVLSTFPFNRLGQSLYERVGYRVVGTYKNQGILDGEFVDVMIMEKFLVKKINN